jgi:hypothetical protein
MLLGEAHRSRGALPAAAVELTAAVELLRRIDHNNRWRAELELARVLAALGRARARARDHATRARDQLAWQRTRLAAGTAPATLDAALAEATALLATLPEP